MPHIIIIFPFFHSLNSLMFIAWFTCVHNNGNNNNNNNNNNNVHIL